MGERTSSMGGKTRLAGLLSQLPLTGTDEEIANSHEINRQSVVKQIFIHVFFMSKYKLLRTPPTVGGAKALTVGAAKAQYIRSTGDNQAAHNAPGQIFCGSAPIQELVAASDDLLLTVENLFGKTDDAPSRFNRADSRAEENGLRNSLLQGCIRVAELGQHARFNRTEQIAGHFSTAFEVYRTFGLQAYQLASQRQRALMKPNDPVENAERERTITILGYYAATLRRMPATYETVLSLFPEDIWREYAAL